jgi:hypothetical protein
MGKIAEERGMAMKHVILILIVLVAGCEAGRPEAKRIIRVNSVGWSDPTTYALVPWDPAANADSPENELLLEKLHEALQSRGFRPTDLSQAEQIIQVRYLARPDPADETGFAGTAVVQAGAPLAAETGESGATSTLRFSISLKACDGPTLRFTGTRVIEMWSLTADITNAHDAGEAIGVLAGVARRYLATETSGTIKVTEKTRAAGQPASVKNPTAS